MYNLQAIAAAKQLISPSDTYVTVGGQWRKCFIRTTVDIVKIGLHNAKTKAITVVWPAKAIYAMTPENKAASLVDFMEEYPVAFLSDLQYILEGIQRDVKESYGDDIKIIVNNPLTGKNIVTCSQEGAAGTVHIEIVYEAK